MSLDTQLKNGTINAQQFTQSFDGLSSSIDGMPEADAIYLMSAALKSMPSELAQSAAGIKNVSDQLLVMKAAALGVAVSAAMLNQLTVAATSKDGGAARAASRVRNKLKNDVKDATTAAAEIAKAFKDAADGGITGGSGEKTPYQIGLEQLKQQRKEIANSATAYSRLVKSGVDGAKAFELSKDATIAAALASAKNGKEWNTILGVVKSVNKEMAAQAVGDYFKTLKGANELQKDFNSIVPTLSKMGMATSDIEAVLSNPDLMQGFVDGLKKGGNVANQIQFTIDRLAEKKTIELQFKLSTVGGQ
jgi:hypothetical protein